MVSSALLQLGTENEGSFRSFNVLVGGLAWFVIIIVALRSTFLHFSVFVSGLITILWYMIPFGLTTMMMVRDWVVTLGENHFASVLLTSVFLHNL